MFLFQWWVLCSKRGRIRVHSGLVLVPPSMFVSIYRRRSHRAVWSVMIPTYSSRTCHKPTRITGCSYLGSAAARGAASHIIERGTSASVNLAIVPSTTWRRRCPEAGCNRSRGGMMCVQRVTGAMQHWQITRRGRGWLRRLAEATKGWELCRVAVVR